MQSFPLLVRPIRVGIIAVALTDDLLSNVGSAAWTASGAGDIEAALPAEAFTVIRPLVVHSGRLDEVRRTMRDWCDAPNKEVRCDLILTVGGDGLSPRDIVPDATLEVIERQTPSLTAYLRQASADDSTTIEESPKRRTSILSRATSGSRASTLIVNLPSCYEKPGDAVAALLPLLADALRALGVEAFE